MKRFAPLLLLGAAGLAACADETRNPIAPAVDGFRLSEAGIGTGIEPTGKHIVLFGKQSVPSGFAARVAELGGAIDAEYGRIGVVVVDGLTDAAAAELMAFDGVRNVEADVMVQWIDPGAAIEVAEVDAEAASAADATANPAGAFFWPRQWHHRVIGADQAWAAGRVGSPSVPRQWHHRVIGADQAWAAGRVGSPSVTVAILDTGINPTHPDLAGRIDFSRSVSFVASDAALVNANFPGMPHWTDLHHHGTHVAATVSSNAVAAAGVTSGVTLMAIKVLGANGSGSTAGVLAGIMYAADNGADVANMSLGSAFYKSLNEGFVSVINRAFNHANRMGTVMVVTAGNNNMDMDANPDIYRAYCMAPNVLCVSATGPTSRDGVNGPWYNVDSRASYSNWGSHVSVAAPGGNGVSTVTAACSQTSLSTPVCRTGVFVIGLNGTSMAAPHVAGLAALMVEDIGKKQPSLVRNRIQQRADDLGVEGRDPIYGRGRINVVRTLGL